MIIILRLRLEWSWDECGQNMASMNYYSAYIELQCRNERDTIAHLTSSRIIEALAAAGLGRSVSEAAASLLGVKPNSLGLLDCCCKHKIQTAEPLRRTGNAPQPMVNLYRTIPSNLTLRLSFRF
jgi:hypothetical protein